MAGTTPLATPEQIVLVLGDFRGDIWVRDLDPDGKAAASNGS